MIEESNVIESEEMFGSGEEEVLNEAPEELQEEFEASEVTKDSEEEHPNQEVTERIVTETVRKRYEFTDPRFASLYNDLCENQDELNVRLKSYESAKAEAKALKDEFEAKLEDVQRITRNLTYGIETQIDATAKIYWHEDKVEILDDEENLIRTRKITDEDHQCRTTDS
jgi:hypothetical protein